MEPELVSFSVELKAAPKLPIASGSRHFLKKVPVLFKAGEYKDKNFTLSPEELAKAVAAFDPHKPVQLTSEHKDSVFNGKLGRLISVVDNKDATFSGYVAVPEWFEGVVPEEKQSLSIEFDRATKLIGGCSWTCNPRIEEAVLTAAFMKDMAAFGDLPDVEADPSGEGKGEEVPCEGRALHEKIHGMVGSAKETADPQIHSPEYIKSLDDIQAITGPFVKDKGKADMSKKPTEKKADVVVFNKESAEQQAIFSFNALVLDRRILPNGKETFLKAYMKLAEQDSVNFSKGEKADLVQTMLAQWTGAKQHSLTEEQLRVTFTESQTLAQNPDKIGKADQARMDKLLASTREGQAVIAARNGTAAKK